MPPDVEYPPFEPHPLLRPANLMTVAGALPRPSLRRFAARAERVVVRVDAVTRVAVEIDRPAGTPRVALMLGHGLVGSARSTYMLGTADKACALGWLVARVTSRNCDDTEDLTAASYHGGLTEDYAAVARHLLEVEGVERLHAAGFSIGGNGILRLAAESSRGEAPPLASVGVACPCIDFGASADLLDRGFFRRFVQRRFLTGLRRIIRRKHAHDPDSVTVEGLDEIRTIRTFDDRYTAPLSGFDGVEDYYARAGATAVLPEITIPTLIVAADDDPLVPVETLDRAEVLDNPSVHLLRADRGGHVAFIGRRPARAAAWRDRDRRWAENRLVQHAAERDTRPLEGGSIGG